MTDALSRRIGLPLLTAYGIGVIVGAGIYVLIGAVAGAAGVWAPLSFLLAGLAEVTSTLLLGVFSLVNLALILLKRSEPEAPFRVPVSVPWAGLLLSLGALGFSVLGAG